MAKSKVVVIPVVTDTDGQSYKLLAGSLREDNDNTTNDVQSISKAQLRKVFVGKGEYVSAATQYRFAGGALCDRGPVLYDSTLREGFLRIGCRTFDQATTRKIRRWLGTAKKAA